jgi:alpha-1,2-mannosyltransferase
MSLADPAQYNNLEFIDGQFPPFNAWVYGGTLLSSLAILAAALFHRSTAGDPGRAFDFCIMALSCTMASPIAWEHHYGILLPICAVLVTAATTRVLWVVWLAVAYSVASVFIPATKLLASTPLNFVQSYVLFAALSLLVMLHWRPWARAQAATA